MASLIKTTLITYTVDVPEADIRQALVMEAAEKHGLTHDGKLIPGVGAQVTYDGRRGSQNAGYTITLTRDPGKSEQALLPAARNKPLSLLTVLDSNGLDDALWVLSYAMPNDRLVRHFQAWCADQVLHVFEADRPDDMRVRNQIAMLRNDHATPAERKAALAAAWDAAGDAAEAAAGDAALDAALAAARVAARVAQETQLRAMIGGGA